MCGIYGQIAKSAELNVDHQIQACNSISCRGPDSQGLVLGSSINQKINYIQSNNVNYGNSKSSNNIFLKHFRLEILDLDYKASQPMVSEDKRHALLFNGEIYNHQELRNFLKSKGYDFFTNHSDTEVLLIGYKHWEEKLFEKLDGQFAISILDFEKSLTLLARDPLGQKPMYYYVDSSQFTFSSSLIPIISNLGVNKKISKESLNTYLRLGVITSPNTIIENGYKLMPGEYIKFDNNNWTILDKSLYWKINDFAGDEGEFNQEEFNTLFNNSVDKRLIADVPIANFLSGGLDSTAITKSIVESKKESTSYSVVFDDKTYDESLWIDEVVQKYNIPNIKENFSFENFDQIVLEAADSFDEPFADPSQIPTYILSKSISKNFRVALSGDGSDELLFGYERNAITYDSKFNGLLSFLSSLNNFSFFSKYGVGRKFTSFDKSLPKRYFSYFEDNNLLKLLNFQKEKDTLHEKWDNTLSPLKQIQLFELSIYTSEFMNTKVDRTSMKNSLEVRSPFQDRKLVEYILSCNLSDKVLTNKKYPVKQYLSKDFSNQFLNREKKGFSFPLYNYIYNDKSKLIEHFLSDDTFIYRELGIDLNILIKNKNKANAHRLWKILMLELWYKRINE